MFRYSVVNDLTTTTECRKIDRSNYHKDPNLSTHRTISKIGLILSESDPEFVEGEDESNGSIPLLTGAFDHSMHYLAAHVTCLISPENYTAN